MTRQEWVDMIWPLAVEACRKMGGYLPEILTAQTCQENGYGQDPDCEVLTEVNNVLGMKRWLINETWESEYWHGGFITKKTPEWDGNEMEYKDDYFRKYDSILDCLCDYLQFMRDARYSVGGKYKYRDVLTIKDPYTLIETVRSRGYCTDPSYTKSVLNIMTEWKLEDRNKGGTTVTYSSVREALAALGVELIDRVAANAGEVPAHNANSHEFFVEHFLGVNGTNPDLYGGGYGGHYFIYRDGRCSQAALPTDKLWHVGANANNGFYYIHQTARNYNCVGVECATFTASGRDDDNETWYMTEATQITSAKLAAAFLTVYGIPMDKLLRHGDVTNKNCPSPHKRDQGLGSNWTWDRYKNEVQKYIDQLAGKKTTLLIGSSGSEVAQLQKDLDNLGYYNIKQNDAGQWYEEHLSIDGDFGKKTEEQVRLFQFYEGLETDGIAGSKTLGRISERLTEMSGGNTTDVFTMGDLELTINNIMYEAKEKGWLYGNSHVYPPCLDNYISCDRMISLALYRHGIKHQPHGGWCGSNLEKALVSMGWVKAADPEKVTGKAVVVMYKNGGFCHAFWQVKYDPATGLCSKYDAGEQSRWMDNVQPFNGVKRNEWTDGRYVGAVYTMPDENKKKALIRTGQQYSIDFTGHRISVDGIFGDESRKQVVRMIQRAANLDYQAQLKEDGLRGPKTDGVMAGHYVELGEDPQFLTTVVEIFCLLMGKDPHGVEFPGSYGNGLAECLGMNRITYEQLIAMVGA